LNPVADGDLRVRERHEKNRSCPTVREAFVKASGIMPAKAAALR
jgi:hypothetical protein